MSVTSKFNFVTQLSEPFLSRTLKKLYSIPAFPIDYTGNTTETLEQFGLTLTVSYSVHLNEPSLSLNPAVVNGVDLKGSIDGQIRVVAHLDSHAGETPAQDYDLPIDAHADFDAVLTLQIVRDGDNVFLQIHAVDLADFDFNLNPDPVPRQYLELIRRILKRVLLVALKSKITNIPLTPLMQAALLGGWAAQDPVLKLMPNYASPGFGNVTLAFNTFPNRGLGVVADLADWVNPNHDFGIAIDQTFLLQFVDRAWQRGQIPTQFNNDGKPDPAGSNVLKSVSFDFLNGTINLSINASVLDSNFWVHGSAKLLVLDGGMLHVDVSDVTVEFPVWVQIVGFVLLTVFWQIVQEALSNFLGGLIAEATQTGLNQFLDSHQIKLAYTGQIPGTNVKLTAVVSKIVVTADDLYTVGQVLFN